MKDSKKVLFVLKFRQNYDGTDTYAYGHYFSSGLYWSAKFVVDMLVESGVDAKLVQVVDNNQIDKEVSNFNPDIVIIEALWVVPEKFDVLKKLHPTVQWVVRLHSNIPFLANDSIAMSWVKSYVDRGVSVAVNNEHAFSDIDAVLEAAGLQDLLIYLPNFYPIGHKMAIRNLDGGRVLRVGCFGAIRPLKNQLIQAIAAIRYADDNLKFLEFHINATRMEQGGNAVLQNLRDLFAGTSHTLVEHIWFSHHDFLHTLRHMDIGMQVSLSETFSIVTADYVSVGLPIVVSPEVPWASWFSKVKATNGGDITDGIARALECKKFNVFTNRGNLRRFSKLSKDIWLDFLKETV